jgi:tetratricopeptide (TPR) repeat protein
LAQWLHLHLEGFRFDRDLIGNETVLGPVPATLRPIFRDREEFSGGHSLKEATIAALDASAALVVLCSTVAAGRPVINEEVRLFRSRHPTRPVIPVIIDGRPPANFPPALRFELAEDGSITDRLITILGPDLRETGDGKNLGLAKTIAGLTGLSPDDIFRRAERVRRRRTRMWAGIAGLGLLLTVLATASAAYAWQQLKTNEAFLSATLKRATEIINTAVTQAEKYHVPRAATVELLGKAEGLFDDMARLGRPTQDLRLRKSELLVEFARSYSVLGRTDLERQHAQAALDLIEELAKELPENEEVQATLSDAFIQVGDVFQTQGHLDAALAQYEVGLAIAKRFLSIPRIGPLTKWQAILSVSNERIGDVLQTQGKLEEAVKYYKANLALSGENSFAHQRMGDTLLALGKTDDALREYRLMLAIDSRLSSSDPDNVEWQRNVSVAHGKVGDVLLAQGKLDEALAEYRADLTIIAKLADSDRTNKGWQRDVAVTYGMIGDTFIAQGNNQQAMDSYKARLALQKRLADEDRQNVIWKADLANSYASIADTYVAEGKLEDALSYYRDSHAWLEQVCAADPSNVQRCLDLLWSNSRLALFGDHSLERFKIIVETLTKFSQEGLLTAEQQRWLPVAQDGLAAVNPNNKQWQWDLLQLYWRTATFTTNPTRQAALVVAMLNRLRDEGKLTDEQLAWIRTAESQLAVMRSQ